jgi:hypothetical protein
MGVNQNVHQIPIPSEIIFMLDDDAIATSTEPVAESLFGSVAVPV